MNLNCLKPLWKKSLFRISYFDATPAPPMLTTLKIYTMKIKFTSTHEDFIKKYLKVLSALSTNEPLSDLEINILTEFLLLDGDKYKHQRFSSRAKDKVVDALLVKYNLKTQKGNINTKLYLMIGKGYLTRDEDNVIYVKDYIIKASELFLKDKTFTLNVQFDA